MLESTSPVLHLITTQPQCICQAPRNNSSIHPQPAKKKIPRDTMKIASGYAQDTLRSANQHEKPSYTRFDQRINRLVNGFHSSPGSLDQQFSIHKVFFQNKKIITILLAKSPTWQKGPSIAKQLTFNQIINVQCFIHLIYSFIYPTETFYKKQRTRMPSSRYANVSP